MGVAEGEIALTRRFPGTERIPRVALGRFPSPVQHVVLPDGALWIKRDDLDADAFGGNKVRALEFLLAGVGPGDVVLTLGGQGSGHVLTTAHHAATLGARTIALQWPHEMHDLARVIAQQSGSECAHVSVAGGAVRAFVRGAVLRDAEARRLAGASSTARVHRVPIGGSSPLGAVGHVNAALELVEQIAKHELPTPARVVVPLGSAGTAAGLAAGFALAGVRIPVIGVRVAPRAGTNALRARWLARRTLALVSRAAGIVPPRLRADLLIVEHGAYGGAYGRPLAEGDEATATFAQHGMALDATYSAKAAAIALRFARHADDTLFWLTFDGRWQRGAEQTHE